MNSRPRNKIAIIIIGTNAYSVLAYRFIQEFRWFGIEEKADFHLFTDVHPGPYLLPHADLFLHYARHDDWVDGTGSKFDAVIRVAESCKQYDYIYYFDADTNCKHSFIVTELLGRLVAGVHYADNTMHPKNFDRNPKQNCYVPLDTALPSTYYYGAFWGGERGLVEAMCRELKRRRDADKAVGYEAAVNDESYTNYWFHFHPPSKVIQVKDFPFAVSDKGGITNTRTPGLDISEIQNMIRANKGRRFDIRDGKYYPLQPEGTRYDA